MESQQEITKTQNLSPRDFMSSLGISAFSSGDKMDAFCDAVTFCENCLALTSAVILEDGLDIGVDNSNLMKTKRIIYEEQMKNKEELFLNKSVDYKSVFNLTAAYIDLDYCKVYELEMVLNKGEKVKKRFKTLTKGVDGTVLPEMCAYVVLRDQRQSGGYSAPRVDLGLIGGEKNIRRLASWASRDRTGDKKGCLTEIAKMGSNTV